MQIYVVIGYTGEYGEYKEWVSKCFIDKQLAKQFKKECQKYSIQLKTLHSKNPHQFWTNESELIKNSPDPFMKIEYTGTNYKIQEKELVTDEFMEHMVQTRIK